MKRMVLAGVAVLIATWVVSAFAQDAAKIDQGKKLFADNKCSLCHSIGGQGGKIAPLDGVGSKLKADEIQKWITDPKSAAAAAHSTKKPPMKTYPNLTKDDVDALTAYLLTLKK